MPSRLKRYPSFVQVQFITFSCYRRLPFLDDDHSRTTFEDILKTTRRVAH